MAPILTRAPQVDGMLAYDFADLEAEFRRDLVPWVRDGKVQFKEDVVTGPERAGALIGMLEGSNFGKLLVQVGAEPTR